MQIYHYDPTTFDFIAPGMADRSPLEEDVYLIPAHATEVAPPEFDPSTHTCRFIDGGWAVAEIPQPEPEPQSVPPTLDDVKAIKLTKLAEKRYEVETGGITVGGINVKTDRESQATLTGAWVTVQINPTALIDWKGADGWAQIDKATVELLAGEVGTHVQRCFSREKAHCDAIDALATIEAVAAYDITTGWEA